ncbi:hypothetical protein D9V37_02415 [Nocardioides mangrovicus]|uniref:Glyoxalase-like domain-containing protein n=1 Tax=Nocardioides mangrovicus TaxID=2478913 RepID=A0A3L8P5Z3_9ACTN|nr:VOC family protein [Nocardioides mangrovicus]RLV50830.1 hypothetical protein D9V37_02415 [Nocardioides mangrovicus]
MTRFKELCLDTADPHSRIADFWAQAAGLRVERRRPDEPGDVLGEEEYQGIAICGVGEAKTVKNRVHLDVYARAVDDLIALGARVLEPMERWTVMADPEGNEFCAFLREDPPGYRVHGIGVDSADAEAAASWWATVLGTPAPVRGHDGTFWTLEHATPDPVLTWDFADVPEPKTVKNRMHWDVFGDPVELTDLGAQFLWQVPGRTRPVAWHVLADPQGNEFCVFPPEDAA